MGRKLKVSPGQIEDYLKENGEASTVAEICDVFDISEPTARKLFRILREEGKPILPTRIGIMDATKITDDEKAKLVQGSVNWLIAILMTIAQIASVSKRPLLQAKRVLESKEDRKQIRQMLITLTRVVDTIDADRLLDEYED